MMKYIALWVLLLTMRSVYGQATFLGFDHLDCRDSLSNNYTYVNQCIHIEEQMNDAGM